MTEKNYPRLCGGTFLTLLLHAKGRGIKARERVKGKKDKVSNSNFVINLMKIFNPDYFGPNETTMRAFRTSVSEYKACTSTMGDSWPLAETERCRDRFNTHYAYSFNAMRQFINEFIEFGTTAKKDIRLVKALLELIDKDDSIAEDQPLYILENGASVSKEKTRALTDICLPAFLLGIWYFILEERPDNAVGKVTYDAWHEVVELRATRKYIGTIGSGIAREIRISMGAELFDDSAAATAEGTVDDNDDIGGTDMFADYRQKAYKKYRETKTPIYDKTPKDFYGFYVCNNLKYNDEIIEDITAAKMCALSRFIIISGTGGLGKSMMLCHLFLDAIIHCNTLKLLPVFISLKNYGKDTDDLFEYIYSAVVLFDKNITREQLTEVLNSGFCLLLFDGMDEIKSDFSARFIEELDKFSVVYNKNHFVLSSRPLRHFAALTNFCELELQPFNKEQALQMINNFEFPGEKVVVKEMFCDKLYYDLWFSHRDFAENPLLLTIMFMIFEEYEEIPSKLYRFYELAFETLAKKHDEKKLLIRELKSGLSKNEIADCLAKVSFLAYKNEKYEFTTDEFNQFLNQDRKSETHISADALLDDLCESLCLFIMESGKYRFIHRSFQEYFCAFNLKKGFNKVSDDKKAQLSKGLIAFFNRQSSYSDTVLDMLYDMTPEKTEEFILIPFLEELIDADDAETDDGYWAFLDKAFHSLQMWHDYVENISYDSDTDEECDESYYDFAVSADGHIPSRILFFIIITLLQFDMDDENDYDAFCNFYDSIETLIPAVIIEFQTVENNERENCRIIQDTRDIVREYSDFATFDSKENVYWFNVKSVREKPEVYPVLLSIMNREDYSYKKLYHVLCDYLRDLKSRRRMTDEKWMEDFV